MTFASPGPKATSGRPAATVTLYYRSLLLTTHTPTRLSNHNDSIPPHLPSRLDTMATNNLDIQPAHDQQVWHSAGSAHCRVGLTNSFVKTEEREVPSEGKPKEIKSSVRINPDAPDVGRAPNTLVLKMILNLCSNPAALTRRTLSIWP